MEYELHERRTIYFAREMQQLSSMEDEINEH
jgi:hypothetical protein